MPAQDFSHGVTLVLPRPLRGEALTDALRPYLRAPAPLGELLLVLGEAASQRLGPDPFVARGWQVRRASDVAAVREQLGANPPDAVVFDLDIPEAREVSEALRRHPGGRRRVVVGVGDADSADDDSASRVWERTAVGVCTAVLPSSSASLPALLETLAVQVYAAQGPRG